jgi:phosphoglycolate phosphatase-like HAD superfamily hydrolase
MIGCLIENPMRRLIMFDLDGTLVHTSAEDALYVKAMNAWLGIDAVNSDWTSYEHVTDAGIATELFQRYHQRAPLPNELEKACDHLLHFWTQKLDQDRSACIPVAGASELLEKLLAEKDLFPAIATGGWGKTAKLKLSHVQLPFRDIAMASSNDAVSRVDIMRLAYQRAASKAGLPHFDGVVYLGDGLWDLAATRDLGYGFIGVGTANRREMLLSKGAAHVISDFCNLEHVIQLMLQETTPENH